MRSIIKLIKKRATGLSQGTVRELCSLGSVLIRRCRGMMVVVFGWSCKRKLLLPFPRLISWGPDVERVEAVSLTHWRSGRGFQLAKGLKASSDVFSVLGWSQQELYQTASWVFRSNWRGSCCHLICQIVFWRTDTMTQSFWDIKVMLPCLRYWPAVDIYPCLIQMLLPSLRGITGLRVKYICISLGCRAEHSQKGAERLLKPVVWLMPESDDHSSGQAALLRNDGFFRSI